MSDRTRPARPRHLATAVLAVACLATAAACAPGPSGDSPKSAAKSNASPVSTDPATAGKVTLTEWDQNTDTGTNASTAALNKAFMKKYPNVTIKRVSRSFSDLKTTLKLALSSDNPRTSSRPTRAIPTWAPS